MKIKTKYELKISNCGDIERDEVITKLLNKVSHPNVVKIMLEQNVYTKSGRLNKSGLQRKTGLSCFEIDKIFVEMREILKNEY